MKTKNSEKYELALDFIKEKHKGQLRTGGLEYYTHPKAVAEILSRWGYGEALMLAGLFHDLLEDTDATEEQILALGGAEVLEAVKLVTKTEGYDMDSYVSAIKASPNARAVKAADRLHNLLCATVCSREFKTRYIAETEKYYLDLLPERSDEMKTALDALAATLDET